MNQVKNACAIDDCGNVARSKGLCEKHYSRLRRTGETKLTAPDAAEQFWSKVRMPDLPEGCWLWTGATDGDGYGVAIQTSRRVGAHRLAYQLAYGAIAEAKTIDHVCHNVAVAAGECEGGACVHRKCVNPSHLATASSLQNVLNGAGPTAVNARKTSCIRGHAFNESNTYRQHAGRRTCRACQRLAVDRYQAKVRAV